MFSTLKKNFSTTTTSRLSPPTSETSGSASIFSTPSTSATSLTMTPSSTPYPTNASTTRSTLSVQTPKVRATSTTTTLSFCVPTTLAFFDRLTWEQTPWIPHTLDSAAVSPISPHDVQTIASHLSLHSNTSISSSSVENALFFGTSYPVPTSDTDALTPLQMGVYPHLFVIFPYAPTTPPTATNETFLKIWHDNIVKPAFDASWHDSGMAPIYGAAVDGQSRILPATGVRTAFDAHPFSGFAARLANREQDVRAVRVVWPPSSELLDQAWTSMTGFLRNYPGMQEYREPVLLAVSRAKVHFATEMAEQRMYEQVCGVWEDYVDLRNVEMESFGVVLETVVGREVEVGMEAKGLGGEDVGTTFSCDFEDEWEEEDEMDMRGSKRKEYGVVEAVHGGNGDGHRNKRRKM